MSNSDDVNSTYSNRPESAPGPGGERRPTGWLYALNSFLERAFLKADVDTGC